MGLDMYMYQKTKGKKFDLEKDIEVAYWRKHNALLNFIEQMLEKPIENTVPQPLTKENLEEILEVSKAIYYRQADPDTIMPTIRGFFFGSTDYDEGYFHDAKITVEQISEILSDTNFDEEEIYFWAWW